MQTHVYVHFSTRETDYYVESDSVALRTKWDACFICYALGLTILNKEIGLFWIPMHLERNGDKYLTTLPCAVVDLGGICELANWTLNV